MSSSPARIVTAALTLSAVLGACSTDGTGTSPDAQVNFSVAVATGGVAATGTTRLATGIPARVGETIGDGENTLEIERVQLVLREIELKRADRDAICGPESEDDACEKLELGPVLLDLPLGTAGAARQFSVTLAAGRYDEIEFEVHKPEDDGDARDRAFLAEHPDFRRTSIRVTGTFNGAPFTFTTDRNFEQEIELSPALDVAEATSTDLTLTIDLARWFRTAGGTLIDPATANEDGANEDLVRDNIEGSLEAFEDGDRDGRHDGLDDDHEDDDS